ncbi:MAG TPA: PD-(D/E)XK nuclease family protein [archaeon]|nr:PD-(D/E)XK nuclease family protein [archaeon]
MDTVVIPVHDFATCAGFCQYITINKFHKKLVPEVKQAQIQGQLLHSRLEDADKLIHREEITMEQLMDKKINLDFPRETIRVAIRRLNQTEFIYLGRVDKAVREKGNIIIIDDKTTSKKVVNRQPFLDRTLQLSCYCEGFVQNYSDFVKFDKIYFKIIQRDQDNNVIYEYMREYDESFRNLLKQNMQIFESIFNKSIRPMHHNNPNKCKTCSFFKECEWKL